MSRLIFKCVGLNGMKRCPTGLHIIITYFILNSFANSEYPDGMLHKAATRLAKINSLHGQKHTILKTF